MTSSSEPPSSEGSPPLLRTVCNELEEVKHKAYAIGIQLGIPTHKLRQFKTEEGGLLSNLVDDWLRGNVPKTPITWGSVVVALKSEQVGEPGLAESLQKKYCSQSVDKIDGDTTPVSCDSTPLNSDVEEDLDQQLKQNLEKILLKYADYVDCIQSIVQKTGVSAKELSSYLLKLPVFIKSNSKKKPTLLSDLKNDLKKAEDVTDVFNLLGEYASFIDYNIFETILKKYGTSEDQKELDYPEHLKSYIESHKVKEFIKLYPTLINPKMIKLAESSKTVNIKLCIDRSKSLSTIKEITRAVADILGVRASTLRLYGVKKGCVLVTLILSSSVAEILFTCKTKFTPQQQYDFQTASVLWLQCNGLKFRFSGRNIQPSAKSDVATGGTSSLAEDKLGAVAKVRKQLIELFADKFGSRLENVEITPFHSAIESYNTENILNLPKEPNKNLNFQRRVERLVKQGLTKLNKPDKKKVHQLAELQDNVKLREALGPQTEHDVNVADSAGWTPLHYACAAGNLSMVKMLISEFKADLSIKDEDIEEGITPLALAAFVGAKDVVKALLMKYHCPLDKVALLGACAGGHMGIVRSLIRKHKADIHAKFYGYTPPHIAALCGYGEIALALVNEFGCSTETRDENFGRSLLHSACLGGDVGLVKTLIDEHSADTDARDARGHTPLHVATASGKDEVLFTLIDEFGCDTKAKGALDRSLVHMACIGSSVNVIRTLVHEFEADINDLDGNNNTPLHLAARHGRTDIVLMLISEFHCDTKLKGVLGRTLLHYACVGGNATLVKRLILQHKSDIHARDDCNDTPLHVAALNGNDEVVLMLINEFHCDAHETGAMGRSLLHKACNSGSLSLVQTLIEDYQADINAEDDNNDTPLQVAALSGRLEVVQTLIDKFCCAIGPLLLHCACQKNVELVRMLIREHKADVDAPNDVNITPVHVAARAGRDDIVKALIIEFGCDTTVRDRFGRSLLHFACIGCSVSLVRDLITRHKADVRSRDNDNNTPLHEAARHGNEKVAIALIDEFGCDTKDKGSFDQSLLHFACSGGSVKLVRTLICKHKVDVNARDDNNDTPLTATIKSGNRVMADHLVECLRAQHS